MNAKVARTSTPMPVKTDAVVDSRSSAYNSNRFPGGDLDCAKETI